MQSRDDLKHIGGCAYVYRNTKAFYIRDVSTMDLAVWGCPKTNPLWILRDDSTPSSLQIMMCVFAASGLSTVIGICYVPSGVCPFCCHGVWWSLSVTVLIITFSSLLTRNLEFLILRISNHLKNVVCQDNRDIFIFHSPDFWNMLF